MPYSELGSKQQAAENAALTNQGRNALAKYLLANKRREKFDQGLSNARSLEGAITPTPQRVEFDISKARALEGLTNKSSEGTGIANIVGRPGYVGSMYKMGDAYYPAGEGSLTDSLDNIASFVKNNPRLSAETTALGAAGTFGKILGQGESFANFVAKEGNPGGRGIRRGTVESMRGELEAPATTSTYLDAASYFTPGTALKGLGVIAKGTAKAAGMGGKIAGIAAGSKPLRIATGLAAGTAAYTGYNEAAPENAEAISLTRLSNVISSSGSKGLLTAVAKTGRSANARASRKLQNITGLSKEQLLEQGIFERVTPSEYLKKLTDFKSKNPEAYQGVLDWEKTMADTGQGVRQKYGLVVAHDKAIGVADKATHGPKDVFFVPGTTNTKMETRTFKEFVADEFATGQFKSQADVVKRYGLAHIPKELLY
jgi:hypothetical protein